MTATRTQVLLVAEETVASGVSLLDAREQWFSKSCPGQKERHLETAHDQPAPGLLSQTPREWIPASFTPGALQLVLCSALAF